MPSVTVKKAMILIPLGPLNRKFSTSLCGSPSCAACDMVLLEQVVPATGADVSTRVRGAVVPKNRMRNGCMVLLELVVPAVLGAMKRAV